MSQVIAIRMVGELELRLAAVALGPRDLGGIKPKQLLELLLLERGRAVPKDRIDLLWGEALPQRMRPRSETYVSVLAGGLTAAPASGAGIVTERGGYTSVIARRCASIRP